MGILEDEHMFVRDITRFPDDPPARITAVKGEDLDGVLAAIVARYGLKARKPLPVRSLPAFLIGRNDSPEILEQASLFGEENGLFKSLSVSNNNAPSLNVRTRHSYSLIQRHGSGVQNLVPILVAALSAEEGETLCLEYPENSLSMNVISNLNNFLSEKSARDNFGVLAATHSPYIFRHAVSMRARNEPSYWSAEKWKLSQSEKDGWILEKSVFA